MCDLADFENVCSTVCTPPPRPVTFSSSDFNLVNSRSGGGGGGGGHSGGSGLRRSDDGGGGGVRRSAPYDAMCEWLLDLSCDTMDPGIEHCRGAFCVSCVSVVGALIFRKCEGLLV